MNSMLTENIDSHHVRFTPDGKVSVGDAIRPLSHFDRPWPIWEDSKVEHPEIHRYCQHYSFQGETPIPVVNSEGWEMIRTLLLASLSDSNLP
jgi:hypothetical protein